MFTREDVSRTKQEFWIAFGRYMAPVPSAEGTKVSWTNYHTGIKDLYFRMEAGLKSGSIAISIESPEPVIRNIYFEQFTALRKVLHEALAEEWIWESNILVDGKVVSRISKDLQDVSVMNKDHWSDLISFFKPRIIALDSFWDNAKYGFETLK